MTDQEINIAIAEFCGWKQVMFRPGSKDVIGLPPKEETNFVTIGGSNDWCFVPNYSTDLNAIHEAEGKLTHDHWRLYLGFIIPNRTIRKLASMEEFHSAWMATARQRAEALLRTIGKWTETGKEP